VGGYSERRGEVARRGGEMGGEVAGGVGEGGWRKGTQEREEGRV